MTIVVVEFDGTNFVPLSSPVHLPVGTRATRAIARLRVDVSHGRRQPTILIGDARIGWRDRCRRIVRSHGGSGDRLFSRTTGDATASMMRPCRFRCDWLSDSRRSVAA